MTLGASFHCCSFSATRRLLVTRRDAGFNSGRRMWFRRRQKTVSSVFRAELTRWKSRRRIIRQNENLARSRAGTLNGVSSRIIFVMRAPLTKPVSAPEVPHARRGYRLASLVLCDCHLIDAALHFTTLGRTPAASSWQTPPFATEVRTHAIRWPRSGAALR